MKKLTLSLLLASNVLSAAQRAPRVTVNQNGSIEMPREDVDLLPADHPFRLGIERLDAFHRRERINCVCDCLMGLGAVTLVATLVRFLWLQQA